MQVPGEDAKEATTQVSEDADLDFLGTEEYPVNIPWHPRKGTVVTCPHQQRQIIFYINKKVRAAVPHLIVPNYGVVNTNANEGVGGRALFSRGKNVVIGPVQLCNKEVRNLLGWQVIQLGRCGIFREWRHNVLTALEHDFGVPRGSLSTSTAREAARTGLRASVAGSVKRRGVEQETKLALRRKRKWRTAEGRRALSTDYDFGHDGNGWDASAKKAEQRKARRAPGALKPYKLMKCCDRFANNHTPQKCPYKPKGQVPQSRRTSTRTKKRPRLQPPPRPPSPRHYPLQHPSLINHEHTTAILWEDSAGHLHYEVVEGYQPNPEAAPSISFGGRALFGADLAPAVTPPSE